MTRLRVRKSEGTDATLRLLLKQASKAFSLSEKGELSAEEFAFADFISLISRCFDHGTVESEYLLRKSIASGIRHLISTGDLTIEGFVGACNEINVHSAQAANPYVMWSDLHLNPDKYKSEQITIGKVKIYIGQSRPSYLRDNSVDALNTWSVYERLPQKSYIWGYVSAETEDLAGSQISYAFESLQALVNFQAHFDKHINAFRNSLHHHSAFQVGPNFYLFDRKRKCWSDTIWMVDHFNPKLWSKQRTKLSTISRAFPAIRMHKSKLYSSPFQYRLINTLRHLNTSWVTPAKSERALSLWLALESLYGERSTHDGQRTIIRRATKDLAGDKWIMEQRLNYLAEIRNSTVHAHRAFRDIDQQEHMIQVCTKFIMSCYVQILTLNTRVIKDENDLFSYFDLPGKLDLALQKNRILQYRIRQLRNGNHDI